MSWKFVFNPSGLSTMTKIAHIARVAEEAGYEFFTVNGVVFFVYDGKYYKTNIAYKDLF